MTTPWEIGEFMELIDFESRKKLIFQKQTLTLDLLKKLPHGWKTVFVYPLSKNSSYDLLCAANLSVHYYLYCNLIRGVVLEEDIPKILQNGFDKILEIALLLNKMPKKPFYEDTEVYYAYLSELELLRDD